MKNLSCYWIFYIHFDDCQEAVLATVFSLLLVGCKRLMIQVIFQFVSKTGQPE